MDGEVISLGNERKKKQEEEKKNNIKKTIGWYAVKFVENFFIGIGVGICIVIVISLMKLIFVGVTALINWLFNFNCTVYNIVLYYLCTGICCGIIWTIFERINLLKKNKQEQKEEI